MARRAPSSRTTPLVRRWLYLIATSLSVAQACVSSSTSLGYNDQNIVSAGNAGLSGTGGSSGTGGDMPVGSGGDAGAGEAASGGDPGAGGQGASGEGGEGGSVSPPPTLVPLVGPPSYPNPFGDDLKIPEADITERINTAYDQLFHGDPDNEAIYFVKADDETQAFILDIYHNDIRTEGLGLAMLISVQLGKKEEFDNIWRFSKAERLATMGYAAGYYSSFCDTLTGPVGCFDPYGMQQFAMSLIFAHDSWGSDGAIDYEADVLELLDVMLTKKDRNGGMGDVTNVFDAESKLPFDVPNVMASSYTRPSLVMPAYYELWEQATGNPFWGYAATQARLYFGSVAHTMTGLMPLKAYFTGQPVAEYDLFGPEACRVMLNIVLDQIWTGPDPWGVDECTKVIDFFSTTPVYGTSYEIDGTPSVKAPEQALVLVNGVTALPATSAERLEFLRAVWEMPIPVGEVRYYHGLVQLYALLVLSGRMQVL